MIDLEREKALNDLRTSVTGLAMTATAKLLSEQAGPESDKKRYQAFLASAGENMTEQARLYGTVLYELKVPEKMVRETGRIFQENPELKAVLDDPTLQETKRKPLLEKYGKNLIFQYNGSFFKEGL